MALRSYICVIQHQVRLLHMVMTPFDRNYKIAVSWQHNTYTYVIFLFLFL